MSINRIVSSRWFGLIDLGCIFIGGTIWYGWHHFVTSPGLQSIGWWPVLIALLPWAARLMDGHFPFKRTGFDLPLAAFLLTAMIGVWAAYDRPAAWGKFVPIVVSILLYYALAGQAKGNLWKAANLLSLFGLLLAIYFLFAYDWQEQPVKFNLVSRVASEWAALRPALPLPSPDSDVTASILAILAPFPLVLGVRNWRSRESSWSPILFPAFSTLTILLCLFLAAERGPWLGLIVAAGVWVWWETSLQATRLIDGLHSRNRSNNQGSRQTRHLPVFLIGLALSFFLGGWLVFRYPGGAPALADRFPGPAEANGRAELWHNASKLISDFPFTGGGLASFSGLYSQYLLVIPFEFVESSHNLFLDVAVEQGIFGLLALVTLLAGSLWYLTGSRGRSQEQDEHSLLRGALAASLLILVVQGFIDNALYSNQDVWGLFLLPGFAAAALPDVPAWQGFKIKSKLVWAAGVFALLVLVGFNQTLLSRWYSDLGAVRMAQVELAGFPTGKWEDASVARGLTSSARLFERALRFDPNNRTAQHRLGLINLLQRDFPSAVSHLEKAYQLDRTHRGIRKALAYSYVWSGDIEQALPLLTHLPEAKVEMGVYITWWELQGRPDLGWVARQVCDKLGEISAPLE